MTKRHDPDEMPIDEWRHRSSRNRIREKGPTTICFAKLCRYASGCPNKTLHPKRIPQFRCARYWPEHLRPSPTVSINVSRLLGIETAVGVKDARQD